MKTNKFRVWDSKMNSFWYGNVREIFGYVPNDIPDKHIQQYTGLKDRKGAEIYEGDILKAKITDEVVPCNNEREINTCVRWDNFYARWIVEGKIEDGLLDGEQYPFGCNENCYIDYFSPDLIDAEIIGNIFETPELLK